MITDLVIEVVASEVVTEMKDSEDPYLVEIETTEVDLAEVVTEETEVTMIEMEEVITEIIWTIEVTGMIETITGEDEFFIV
jgi:hypothetical protein